MPNLALSEIADQLNTIESHMIEVVERCHDVLSPVHESQLSSAKNLLYYLSLRNEDIRSLQIELHLNGLSALTNSESHIRSQLQSILCRLGRPYDIEDRETCTYDFAHERTAKNSSRLFGEKTESLSPHIMVTFDATYVNDYSYVKNLLINGMNIARINCAHDDHSIWLKMVRQIKKAVRLTGIPCKIYMDLAGPKIRAVLLKKGKQKGKVKIKEGDVIWLAENAKNFLPTDIVVSPNENGIVAELQKGARVYFDDGVIKAIVVTKKKNAVGIRIVRVSSGKGLLRSGKGINFPDSSLKVESLTAFDLSCLEFVCLHADMVGMSFVREVADLQKLQGELLNRVTSPPNIIIKIETPESVKNLPGLILAGMKMSSFGIMIARGDLAVEIGFERMGEIQEEILWISEAAHVPVIWATQVLETLNKSGMATRSEITDAAHANMAECVMINKGSHTVKVISTLKEIFKRMGGHHIKKRYTFRPLEIAKHYLANVKKPKAMVTVERKKGIKKPLQE